MAGGEVDVGVEGGGEAAQQRDGGLGAAFLDALDVVLSEGGPRGKLSDRQAGGAWWSRSQVFCTRTARSIMNQLAAGAADAGASMRMLRDLLKEL